jgi:hypothetical protein
VDSVVFKSVASIVPVPLKVPDGESIFTTLSKFLRHIDTVNHGAQLERRVQFATKHRLGPELWAY